MAGGVLAGASWDRYLLFGEGRHLQHHGGPLVPKASLTEQT